MTRTLGLTLWAPAHRRGNSCGGGQAVCEGPGPDTPVLPLQKEGPSNTALAHDAEGGRLNRAQPVAVPKRLEARWGGFNCTISQPKERDCSARAAMKPRTAPVCSTLRSNWRLSLSETFRQGNGLRGSMRAGLHHFRATPTQARSHRGQEPQTKIG